MSERLVITKLPNNETNPFGIENPEVKIRNEAKRLCDSLGLRLTISVTDLFCSHNMWEIVIYNEAECIVAAGDCEFISEIPDTIKALYLKACNGGERQ